MWVLLTGLFSNLIICQWMGGSDVRKWLWRGNLADGRCLRVKMCPVSGGLPHQCCVAFYYDNIILSIWSAITYTSQLGCKCVWYEIFRRKKPQYIRNIIHKFSPKPQDQVSQSSPKTFNLWKFLDKHLSQKKTTFHKISLLCTLTTLQWQNFTTLLFLKVLRWDLKNNKLLYTYNLLQNILQNLNIQILKLYFPKTRPMTRNYVLFY